MRLSPKVRPTHSTFTTPPPLPVPFHHLRIVPRHNPSSSRELTNPSSPNVTQAFLPDRGTLRVPLCAAPDWECESFGASGTLYRKRLSGRTFTSWDDERRRAPLQSPPNAREQRATEVSSGPLFLRLGGRLSLRHPFTPTPFHSALSHLSLRP